MKRIITLCLFALLFAGQAISQNYEQAAGLRLGAAGGITYRRLLGTDAAGEIMLLSQNHGSVLVLLFEKQKPAVLFDDLNLTFIYMNLTCNYLNLTCNHLNLTCSYLNLTCNYLNPYL